MYSITLSYQTFGLSNTASLGLLILLLVLLLIIILFKNYRNVKSQTDYIAKDEDLRLMALFSEIDPDPVLRVDTEGIIVGANNTAKNDFKGDTLIGRDFSKLIEDIDLKEHQVLDNKVVSLNDRYYNLSIRRLDSLGFSQIYLHDITKRIEFEKQIEEYQQNLKKLRAKLENYNEIEKQMLGKELHDSIGQNISLLKIKVQNFIEKGCDNNNRPQFLNLLDHIDKLSSDVREISHQLRPRILNEFGLIAALSSMIESINKNSDMNGTLSSNKKIFKLNDELEVNLYRICQEAINNIVKHSECSNFFLQFVFNENELKIIISDDGKGFNKTAILSSGSSSLGLLNMRERVENFGGKLSIETSPDEGTTHFIHFKDIEDFFEYDTNSSS